MLSDPNHNISASLGYTIKARAYGELLKARLSFMVAFSSGFGYALASPTFNWMQFISLFIGGFLVSGAAVTINQIIEREADALMSRTMNRPIPTGRITVAEAAVFACIVAISGLALLLATTNFLTTILSFISLILYSFVYTPLKRKGPVAVFVGAVPGALPPLLGWVAATGTISIEALLLFSIQFVWQFPHFWAIAWVSFDDYKKAGFKLLPFGGEKNLNNAIQIMTYTLFLLPLGVLPAKLGITGINSAMVATLCGALFLAQTFALMKDGSRKSALRIMYGSFIYLPIVQIAFLLDKI